METKNGIFSPDAVCLWGRKARCDITVFWKLASLSVTHCDISQPWAVTSHPSPLIFGHRQSLGQSGSCLASCRVCLRGLKVERGFSWCWVVLWGLLPAALGVHPRAIACVSPALPGSGSRAPRAVLAAAQVSRVGNRPPGWPWGR